MEFDKDMYWVIGENAWSKGCYTEEQAKEAAARLIDCKGCVDCEWCENCRGCTGCYDCRECVDCLRCWRCEGIRLEVDWSKVKAMDAEETAQAFWDTYPDSDPENYKLCECIEDVERLKNVEGWAIRQDVDGRDVYEYFMEICRECGREIN